MASKSKKTSKKKKLSLLDRLLGKKETFEKPPGIEYGRKTEPKRVSTKSKLINDRIKRAVIEKHPKHKKLEKSLKGKVPIKKTYVKTGIPGFDDLMDKGIPKGLAVLVAGGPGTGKTIFTLQTMVSAAKSGKKILYISFEESFDRLKEHIEGFGWNLDKEIQSKQIVIKRFDPFKLSRSVEALLAQAKGELLIDVGVEDLIPKGFNPDIIMIDSITALASAFVQGDETYRIYIEQLFRFFEKLKATTFLISETEDAPKKLSESGVEEFLADAVFVIYNIRQGNVRERAIEILKMRGAKHQEKIVAMQITGEGIIVYPEQEVFGGIES